MSEAAAGQLAGLSLLSKSAFGPVCCRRTVGCGNSSTAAASWTRRRLSTWTVLIGTASHCERDARSYRNALCFPTGAAPMQSHDIPQKL